MEASSQACHTPSLLLSQSKSSGIARTHYLNNSNLQSKCQCRPCGTPTTRQEQAPNAHNGYWTFMSNPGEDMCGRQAAALLGVCNEKSFTAIAKRHLRGKKMLVYGDSIVAMVFFSMVCDLRSHGMLESVRFWPSDRSVFYKLPWPRGIIVPALSLNITFLGQDETMIRFCSARQSYVYEQPHHARALAREATGTLCERFWTAAATEYDVIVGNLYGFQVYRNLSNFDRSIQPTLSMLQAVAELAPSKKFVILDNSAQHFMSLESTGRFEDRKTLSPRNASVKTCFCNAINVELARRTSWQNRKLHKWLADMPLLRLLPMFDLTAPYWAMHVARTRSEHNNAGATVCDCTHFCYSPDFWRGAFFPALEQQFAS